MPQNSKISWTDHTFNPWVGCTKISDACKHCYAEAWAKRSGQAGLWHGERRRTSEANWKLPLKWQDEAKASGKRARVFSASLADIFEDHPAIEPGWRDDLWALIERTPDLDWLLLTKRPENIQRMWPWGWYDGQFTWPNIWIGTTVENQVQADKRIPELLKIPARVRFLSCEPLLGPVDLTCINFGNEIATDMHDVLFPQHGPRYPCNGKPKPELPGGSIHWVIVGGESGPGFRQFDLKWARSLQRQCEMADIAFHFKQHGGIRPDAGGCLLDGVEYKQFPA